MFKPLIASLMLTSAVVYAKPMPLTAARYAQQLGVGMDVDWARTERGIREFDPLVVRDFKAKGLTHVRIRVAGAPTEARLIHLRKLVEACEYYGVIPIIAYQADAYKTDPSASHEKELINWWSVVARYFGQTSPLLGFDLIYEPADKLNHNMARWMPETRPAAAPRTRLIASYKTLFGNGAFNCYLLMLIGGLAGIAVFEACSGVLMGAVLGLSSMVVSILFILPIPAAFFGAWFAGRPNKRFSALMWQSVICCLLAGLMMWIPGWFGVMNVWTLLIPAALFFFGAGMLFPLATSGAMEPFPFLAGTAGALVGGLQNIGSGVLAWLSAMLPQNGQGSLGLLMTLMGLLILACWLPLASRISHQGQTV